MCLIHMRLAYARQDSSTHHESVRVQVLVVSSGDSSRMVLCCMGDMMHSYGRDDSFIYERWLIQTSRMVLCCMGEMTHSYGRDDAFIRKMAHAT